MKCFTCNNGNLIDTTIEYTAKLSNGQTVIVKNVLITKCDACGEELFDKKASKTIEDAIIKQYPYYFHSKRDKALK